MLFRLIIKTNQSLKQAIQHLFLVAYYLLVVDVFHQKYFFFEI